MYADSPRSHLIFLLSFPLGYLTDLPYRLNVRLSSSWNAIYREESGKDFVASLEMAHSIRLEKKLHILFFSHPLSHPLVPLSLVTLFSYLKISSMGWGLELSWEAIWSAKCIPASNLFKGMTFDDQFDLTGQDDIELKFKH
jgi:hypothetical protein